MDHGRQGILGVLSLALLGAAGVGQAADKAELFKCVDAAGVISIQSTACPSGSTQVWKRDATPEPAPTPEQRAEAEVRRLQNQKTVRELSEQLDRRMKATDPAEATPPAPAPAAPPPAPPAPDRCEQAQDFAAQLREKSWLELSEEQVRRLYAWVATQCQPTASR